MLETCILVASICTFIILLLDKWGIREWLIVHSKCGFVSRLFSCYFCLSFWFSLIVTVLLSVLYYKYSVFNCIFITIICATITRKLL